MTTHAGEMQTAAASTAAVLTGGTTAAGAPQTALLTALQGNTAGGFNIDAYGSNFEIGPIDFTGAASLTVCATRINTAISGAGCTCTWSATHFVITTSATGPTATLTYATVPSGPTVETDISATCLLTSGTATSLVQGSQGTLNPQWVPCDGRYIRTRTPFGTPRPHAGLLYSTGTTWDYWMRVGRQAGAHGITPKPDALRVPYDPGGTWYISTADDSSETTLTNPPTPQHPPPGVR